MAISLKKISYFGWANTLELDNGIIRLAVTTDVGPRIISFGFTGGQNLFKNVAEELGQSGDNEWVSYGGHRLWRSPELPDLTYYPDNVPVDYNWDGKILTLITEEKSDYPCRKIIKIELANASAKVKISQEIINTAANPVAFGAWGITVMAPGGTAILPQEEFAQHGENDNFLPVRPLALWSYTDMSDPRFVWGDKFVLLSESGGESRQKIGVFNSKGWVAYWLQNELFVKRFAGAKGEKYPDMGCNNELFTMAGMLEVEALSEVREISPGDSATLVEDWELIRSELTLDDQNILKNQLKQIGVE